MSEVTQRIVAAYEALGRAVQESLTGNGSEAVPEPVHASSVFEYTDHGNDTLTLVPGSAGKCTLSVNSCLDHVGVHLDQDAVNRLAQYLDRHRTDLTDTPKVPVRNECSRCVHTVSEHGPAGCMAERLDCGMGSRCPCTVTRGVLA